MKNKEEQITLDDYLKNPLQGVVQRKSRSVAVQHNSLVEARYKLTLNEQKLMLFACSKIDRSKKDFELVRIPVNEIAQVLSLTRSKALYARIDKVFKGLLTKDIYIFTKAKNNTKRLLHTTWMSSCEYSVDGWIEYEFSKKLKQLLLNLKKHYTTAFLDDIIKFKSEHTIRLYLIARRYKNLEYPFVLFDYKEFKKMLGLEGKYKSFKDFKKYVLDRAKKELSENRVGLNFIYEEERFRKSVVRLKLFFYNPKKTKSPKMPKFSFDLTMQGVENAKIFKEYWSKHNATS